METKPGIVPPYLERAAQVISQEEGRLITLPGLRSEPWDIKATVRLVAAEAMITEARKSLYSRPRLRRAGDGLLNLCARNYIENSGTQTKLKNS
jgi:hypothetical protein